MLRLACALGALQTVADAFPAIPLVPRVRCAPQTPVASMRPPRIAAFAVAGEPGVDVQEGGWSRPLVLVSLVIGAISLRDSTRGQEDSSEEDLSAEGATAARIRGELAALTPLPNSSFCVEQTTDGRGLGLFVGRDAIPAGTYLCDYLGEIIGEREFARRYRSADAEYAVGIKLSDGSSGYIDAASPELSNLARYANHESVAPNLVAWTLFEPGPRLLLFTSKDVDAGIELVWDYGEAYWRGSEDELV